MRALAQRVAWADVQVQDSVIARIERGLLVYLGVADADGPQTCRKMAEKIATLRVFEDEHGKMNRSLRDVRGGVLAVPSFTLQADTGKGRRPSFEAAASPQQALGLFEDFLAALRQQQCTVAAGRFGAHMRVQSEADGPVNLVLDVDGRQDIERKTPTNQT